MGNRLFIFGRVADDAHGGLAGIFFEWKESSAWSGYLMSRGLLFGDVEKFDFGSGLSGKNSPDNEYAVLPLGNHEVSYLNHAASVAQLNSARLDQ